MAKDKIEFGLMGQSVVREMANIGLGHATTALANMTSKPFNMCIPDVESIHLESLPLLVGDPSGATVGVYMPIEGDAGGYIAFLMPWLSAQGLWKMLLGQAPNDIDAISDLDASVMLELGNIINSGFLNAISDMTGLSLHATPPRVSADMCSAIIGSLVCEASYSDTIALAIRTKIHDEAHSVDGFFVYIPTVDGIRKVFKSLGISEAA